MAASDRGRSPSAGRTDHLRHSTSASPHPPLGSSFNGADPSVHSSFAGTSTQTTTGAFLDASFTQDYSQQAQFSLGAAYSGYHEQSPQQQRQHQQQQQEGQHQGVDFADGSFQQVPGLQNTTTTVDTSDTGAFPSFDFDPDNFDASNSVDPALLSDLDPSSLNLLSSQQEQTVNGSLNPMATTLHTHAAGHTHFTNDMQRQSGSPSPHTSPSFQQAQFQSMQRPRNISESLDPLSAMFPQGQQNEWGNMGAYRSHKRAPSDNLSDISSNHASPYMNTLDSFDAHSSPLLDASSDPALHDGLGLQGFSLSETQAQAANYVSPGHSPGHSPHLMPQAHQNLPAFLPENSFGLNTGMNGQFQAQAQNGLEMFPGVGQEPFPSLNQQELSPRDMGQADHMSPPEINIEYAPSSKPVERMSSDNSNNALSPPLRTSRVRAKSDSYAGSRPASPAFSGRGRSPSLQPQASGDSLSPFDNQPPSRSSSPGRGRSGSGSRVRSSSNGSDQREYILDLADPQRTPSNGADSKRVQKHPATFQCTLCPKRFTRAYNLRSHLRTHTDERPFVCTVCGKAFARQHDRKRHEGLHSGEKKFVCRGQLQSGAQWGCGRRFARADALGRHFRSEAGRVCIRPLLDEEAADRQKAWLEEQQQAQVAAGYVAPQPMMAQPQMDMINNFLPAALIQQYPALAGIDWNSVPQGPPPDEEYISGRSSFDASSGGEYYEDISENEMNPYQDSNMTGMSNMNMQQQQQQQMGSMPAQSVTQQAAFGGYGGQTGDYLSDFEGR